MRKAQARTKRAQESSNNICIYCYLMAFGQCRRPPVDPAPVDPGPRPCRPIAAMALLGLQLLRACNRRRQGLQERAPGTGRARGLQRDGGHRLQWQGPGPAAGAATAGPESGSGSGTAMAERGPATGGRQRVRLQLPGLQAMAGTKAVGRDCGKGWTETAGEGCRKLTSQHTPTGSADLACGA